MVSLSSPKPYSNTINVTLIEALIVTLKEARLVILTEALKGSLIEPENADTPTCSANCHGHGLRFVDIFKKTV